MDLMPLTLFSLKAIMAYLHSYYKYGANCQLTAVMFFLDASQLLLAKGYTAFTLSRLTGLNKQVKM